MQQPCQNRVRKNRRTNPNRCLWSVHFSIRWKYNWKVQYPHSKYGEWGLFYFFTRCGAQPHICNGTIWQKVSLMWLPLRVAIIRYYKAWTCGARQRGLCGWSFPLMEYQRIWGKSKVQVIFLSWDSEDYEVDICVNFSLGCYMDLSVQDLPKPSTSVLVKAAHIGNVDERYITTRITKSLK